MAHKVEPVVHKVKIEDLRPTQFSVGMYEVKEKIRSFKLKSEKKEAEFIGSHMVPVVLGYNDKMYLVDHHHLCRALHESGEKHVLVTVIADLSMLPKDSFWFVMEQHNWTFLYDQQGERRPHRHLPTHVKDLQNDPYRSLAGNLRKVGGYSKNITPFSEFLWAEYLRRLVTGITDENMEEKIQEAIELAKAKDASYLPGWCGPS
jgi:hypothetical protein